MSTKRFGFKPWWGEGKRPQGPNGERLCKMCPKTVASGRREYCSETCSEEYLIRTRADFARAKIERRDRGICTNCGLDTKAIERVRGVLLTLDSDIRKRWQKRVLKFERRWPQTKRYSYLCEHYDPEHGVNKSSYWCVNCTRCAFCFTDHGRGLCWFGLMEHREPLTRAFDRMLRRHGFDPTKTLWEMDHEVPVIEGGGQCGLDNLRTLCVPCHRDVTRALKRRLAKDRKAKSRAEATTQRQKARRLAKRDRKQSSLRLF